MDVALVVGWSQQAIRIALLLGFLPLLIALGVGVVVGVAQTLTQVNEPVVGLVPRLVAVLLVVLVALPWLISTWVTFAVGLIAGLPESLG